MHPSPTREDATFFVVECPAVQAAALIGADYLPAPPKRKVRPLDPCVDRVARARGGRILIHAHVTSEARKVLAAFSPVAIRELAPEGPTSAAAWKQTVRDRLDRVLAFSSVGMIEITLRRPVWPMSCPGNRDSLDEAIERVNRRFRFQEEDIQHMVGLYARFQRSVAEALGEALDRAVVQDTQLPERPLLRLVTAGETSVR